MVNRTSVPRYARAALGRIHDPRLLEEARRVGTNRFRQPCDGTVRQVPADRETTGEVLAEVARGHRGRRIAAAHTCVDRLSLFLSQRDSTDERIQKELKTLVGGVAWSSSHDEVVDGPFKRQ